MKTGIDWSAFSSVEELAQLLEERGAPEAAAKLRECANLDEVRERTERIAKDIFSAGRFSGQGTYTPPEED